MRMLERRWPMGRGVLPRERFAGKTTLSLWRSKLRGPETPAGESPLVEVALPPVSVPKKGMALRARFPGGGRTRGDQRHRCAMAGGRTACAGAACLSNDCAHARDARVFEDGHHGPATFLRGPSRHRGQHHPSGAHLGLCFRFLQSCKKSRQVPVLGWLSGYRYLRRESRVARWGGRKDETGAQQINGMQLRLLLEGFELKSRRGWYRRGAARKGLEEVRPS